MKISQARPPCSLGTSALGRPKVSWRRCHFDQKNLEILWKNMENPYKTLEKW
jgi:hypothetical protein